jgi:dolichyl-phosphate beta-glucosyltransferase
MKKKIKNITFVIPIFNEAARLNYLFKRIYFFINKYKNIKAKFILINDGSKDNSKKKIDNFINKIKKIIKINISLINYKTNKGKGFAIKKGILGSTSDWIITLDADLSVDFSQVIKWNNKFEFNTNRAYWGSRVLKSSRAKSIIIRRMLGLILFFILKIFFNFKIKDTQCGFKLYHKSYVKKLFNNLDIYDFTHDIKLLILLMKFNVEVEELPVNWTHYSNSKVRLFYDSINFFIKIIVFKFQKIEVR